jgi:multiple sugar transport system substrate-binding protein
MKQTQIFRPLAFLLALLLTPLFLSGCQKKCPTPAKNIPGTAEFRSDCPYSGSSPTGSRELDFYFVYDNTDDYREQIQAFQSANPGLIVRPKKFANIDEYRDLVTQELADGEGPDVFMIHNTWVPLFQKRLLPLPASQPKVMNADLFRQTFFPAASDDLLLDDQIYGMPLSIDNLAIYYNKKYFKDLIATTDKPAELWEGIKEQVFALTKRNNSPERFSLAGIALGRADNISSAIDILYALMIQHGAVFYDDKEESATFARASGASATGQTNPGADALTLLTSFALPSYKNYSWNDTITGFAPEEKEVGPFARGKVAMIVGYPYLYNTIVQSIQNQQRAGSPAMSIEDIGIAPFPQLVSTNEGLKRDAYASYYPLVVARTSNMQQDAWNFVQFLTSADALQTYHKKTHRPTSRRDMVQEQSTEPLFGVFAYQASFAKSLKIYDDAAYYKVFYDAIQAVVHNTLTPEEALTEAQTKITCFVKKRKGLVSTDTDCGI